MLINGLTPGCRRPPFKGGWLLQPFDRGSLADLTELGVAPMYGKVRWVGDSARVSVGPGWGVFGSFGVQRRRVWRVGWAQGGVCPAVSGRCRRGAFGWMASCSLYEGQTRYSGGCGALAGMARCSLYEGQRRCCEAFGAFGAQGGVCPAVSERDNRMVRRSVGRDSKRNVMAMQAIRA
jgi:hypothetical protein